MGRLLEYFLVCGLGPDLQTTHSPPDHGYFGSSVCYQPALLDQYPRSEIADCPDPPPQLPLVSLLLPPSPISCLPLYLSIRFSTR